MKGFQSRQQRERDSRQKQSGSSGADRKGSSNQPSPRMLGSGAAANAGFALANRRRQIDDAAGYADGGVVRGPGTGTSDDIKTQVPEGSYIMPADSTQAIGESNLEQMGGPIDVNLSNGEYQLPPEQVHAVGVQALNQMRDQTHVPTGKPQVQGDPQEPELFFADGGEVEDPRRRVSQSRALVPVSQPAAAAAASPQASVQPSPGTMYTNSSGQTGRGFMPSSSRAVVPVGTVANQQPGRSLVPSGPLVEHPRPEGIDQRTRDQLRQRVQADSANWQAQRAAQDARFGGGQPPASGAAPRGFMSRALRAAGPLAAVASVVPEARDVANVAGADNTTGLDVATQASEGVARVAGTGAGAALGAKAGGVIGAFGGPIAVPVGSLIGAGIGGFLGNRLSDGAIDLGRRATGQDAASPAERLVGGPSAPARMIPQAAAEEPAPQPMPQPMPQPGAPARQPAAGQANNVIREGNSFYADGPITQGFTVNGQSPAVTESATRSPQNEAAVQALLARTPEFGAGAGATQARGFQPGGSRVTVVPDSGRMDSERARAFAAASTPHAGAQNRQLTAAQINAMRGLISDEQSAGNQRYATDAGLVREEMSQAGADRRAASRDSIDLRRVAGEEEARGFQTRAAERVERLYEQYESAATPEERSAIAEQMRVLSGDSQAPRYAVAAGGQIVDPNTQQLITQPAQVFNTQTGQFVDQRSALPPLEENPAVQQILQDTSLSREERARRIRALGYQ